MTADDLTRLRDEFNKVLADHALTLGRCGCGYGLEHSHGIDEAMHRAHVASVLASSPTVAALIDRVERAERERDKYRKHAETCRFGIELGDLRDGIRQLADEWHIILPEQLRSLLTEGADDGQ